MNTKWEESFDKRFGKAGEDKNSDSIGRDAGCDDCSACIELREEHKAFIKDQITEAEKRGYKQGVTDGIENEALIHHSQASSDMPECEHDWFGREGDRELTCIKCRVKRLSEEPRCCSFCECNGLQVEAHNWNERLKKFFKKQGYEVYWKQAKKPPARGKHIVCGDSLKWKTFSHVVVYKNGQLIYDPQHPSAWSPKRITHKLIIKKT